MASRKTLNARNLEALGATRLAELLIEVSAGNAAAKRRLRLELAGAQSPHDVAKEVRKRLATIGRSRSFIDWDKRRALVDDLETQRSAILDPVAKADPTEALDLMWRFVALADSVLNRCDDTGAVLSVFHTACQDLGTIAAAANPNPISLAGQTFNALCANDYGQFDDLLAHLGPILGAAGLDHLKTLFIELWREPLAVPPDAERIVFGWSASGPMFSDEFAKTRRDSTIRLALLGIADAQGDVDGFIALQSEKARTVPGVAAGIAQRLLAAGRADDAWEAINAVDQNRTGWLTFEWEQARIDVLEAQCRSKEAQACRWDCFERTLSAPHLRAYIKQLPDFDDIEAEERALSYAQTHPSVHTALMFLTAWPALERAAQLVQDRWEEIDGDHYEIVGSAANALEAKYPLAAILLRRAMIDFALDRARSSRYRHAARHLAQCESLEREVADHGRFETHDAYLARLRRTHGRKTGFWSLLT